MTKKYASSPSSTPCLRHAGRSAEAAGQGRRHFFSDVFFTGKGARLEIRMIDDAEFTLGERTLFVVEKYFLEKGQGKLDRAAAMTSVR